MRRTLLALLLGSFALNAAPRIVLIAGKPSHGAAEHEFNAGMMLLEKCLRQNKVEPVLVKGGWPDDESVFDGASALVFYEDGGVSHPMIQDGRLGRLAKRIEQGVGLACLHYAVEVPKERGGEQLLDWIGGYYERPYSQNPVNFLPMKQAAPKHPISRGWKSFAITDEWYYKIRFRPDDRRITPILTTLLPPDEPVRETVAWATERGDGGRGFGFTGGHFHQNWGNPDFRRMIVNAILWTAKINIPRAGAKCELTAEDLVANLDKKPKRKNP